jgi:Fe-S-cluster containining protein
VTCTEWSVSDECRDGAYFAFASGRLGYSCATCNALCCRGHGYALRGDAELANHTAERPLLRVFIERHGPQLNVYRCRNYQPCYFLRPDRQCSLHTDYGYDAKPATCKLFPFNNLIRFGQFVVVAPHPGLCPLVVEGVSERAFEESNYHTLWSLVRSTGADGAPSIDVSPDVADGVIERERRIRELSERHLGVREYMPFAMAQEEVSLAPGSGTMTTRKELEAFHDTLANVLEVSSAIVRGADG